MNVLLVDDDYFVIAALETKIGWAALGVERVFTAFNISQAREILLEHPVGVLVCDIEMPQGSGLELLSWIREESLNVQAIFLTNYADFNYAQKAIGLQSFDYFLKPIEFDKLTLILRKAIAKAGERRGGDGDYAGSSPESRLRERKRSYWQRLAGEAAAQRPVPAGGDSADRESTELYGPDDVLIPVLLNLFPRSGSLAREDKALFDYALLNIAEELLGGKKAAGEARSGRFELEAFCQFGDSRVWVALRRDSAEGTRGDEPPADDWAASACSALIRQARELLKCGLCCSMGVGAPAGEVPDGLRELAAMNESLVLQPGRLFRLDDYRAKPHDLYVPPDLGRLERLLNENRFSSFLDETRSYLNKLEESAMTDRFILHLLRLDLVQLVYVHLKNREIQAHQLYAGAAGDRLFADSARSTRDMQAYIDYLVRTAADYLSFADRPDSVARELQRYIGEHYGDDLTRGGLAEVFFLNPDYLARLFKRETGISLGAYIIRCRIDAARRLLESTRCSVGVVAGKVGYANDSHFAKLFKQEIGVSPNEYRRLHEAGEAPGPLRR
ncbi:helix-turn-helix domain-containing protein [Saccharibacillus sp. CPCC 101409]|uniref:helix-turn-helix domain-containing protein n=1 Tax=Saccharibacillus sp. CPCC 101409 TaxID=3058041 RepID=UPI0026715CD7|nr:helix-turn-helix domain-containing protein [Saccharibacillus sp. CPCC 101409]MDO3409308.1 helix-turn-helix domain-containing protein [Saccharibacillus sp. CPCC 101409]